MKRLHNGDEITNKIDRYIIQNHLGEGGTAVVYQALHANTQLEVALKVNKTPIHLQDKNDNFGKEAEILLGLNHRNIIKAKDIFVWDGYQVLVQELVVGSTLEEKIENKKIDIEKAINYTLEVISGLKEIHKKGMLHRDIKPANLMIGSDNRVKILDFGSVLDKEEDIAGKVVGTVAYMSPQAIDGEFASVQTEIYSLGVMLYEMLAGKKPFEGDVASIDLISNGDYRSLREINSAIPTELSVIVDKMMHIKTSQRYKTLEAVGEELTKYMLNKTNNNLEIIKQKQERVVKNIKNFKWFVLGLVIALAGSVAVMIWMLMTNKN